MYIQQLNNNVFFHGTKNKIDKVKAPTVERPFFVCGDVEYAYVYAHAGQVNGRTNFEIKQETPGYVYALALSTNTKLFDALNNNCISQLSHKYPKYVIESLKTKQWSIWSIFQHINSILYGFYSHKFKTVDQLKKFLDNKNFEDQLGNALLYNGIDKLINTYNKQYRQIYSPGKNSWNCLFELITLFNSHLVELGYNSFINRENVSKIKEDDDKIVTKCAIGLFDEKCLKRAIPYQFDVNTVKHIVKELDKKNIEKQDAVQKLKSIVKIKSDLLESKKQIDFSKYEIIELHGKDLEAVLPYLRPLIKKSYEKIGGKQGDRTVDQLKAVQTIAQVVYDKGKIIAYALGKKVHSNDIGNKLNLIGCDQTWKGKEAMQAIIKYNIDNFKANVWCECSGVIEHWFKKYDGYPIPNQLVPEIIGEPRDKVWFHEDGYHYRRFLAAAHGRFVQKIMFGFVNNDIMRKTLNQIGYDIMRDRINNKINEKSVDNTMSALQKAEEFVQQMDKLAEDGMQEILPNMAAFLNKAVEILIDNNSEMAPLGKKLLKTFKPIEVGQLKV